MNERIAAAIFSVAMALPTTLIPPGHGEEGGWIGGAGALSCDRYTKEFSHLPIEDLLFVASWAQGYITARDLRNTTMVGQRLDPYSITDFIENYCNEHPLEHIVIAVEEMYGKLRE